MTRAFRCLFVHGVGEQPRSFANTSRAHLRVACGKRDVGMHSVAAWWAPLADAAEHAFLREVKSRGSSGRPAQELTIGTLSDALYYQSSQALKAKIYSLLDRCVGIFAGLPFTAFCHSLGGLVFTDWLRQRPHVKGVQLVTFGCNIGLFTLGSQFAPVPQVAAPGSWINLFDRQDLLGYPLARDSNLRHVRDVPVNVGRWWQRWNGLSHIGYFGDRKLWRRTIPELIQL